MYYNVSKVPGFILLFFQHFAISSSFTTSCTIQVIMSNLCQNLSVSRNWPLDALIKKYVDKTKFMCYFVENFDFHQILWRLL